MDTDDVATIRHLGELIVERGLITQAELEDALLEQQITRERLGTILVSGGIVSASELNALVGETGFEDLLGELEQTEAQADGEPQAPPAASHLADRAKTFPRRFRVAKMSRVSRLGAPFTAVGGKAKLRRRHRSASGDVGDAPEVAPAETVGAEERPVEAPVARADLAEEETVQRVEVEADAVESVGLSEPELETVPELEMMPGMEMMPELETEPQLETEPGPEPEPELETEPEPVPEWVGQHRSLQRWLSEMRQVLDTAEAELARLDAVASDREQELGDLLDQLKAHEDELASEIASRAHAENEVALLHGVIVQLEAGMAELEAAVEELRAVTQADLADLRRKLETTRGELEQARAEVAGRDGRIAELEAMAREFEQRARRAPELEVQVADLTESLAATDETLAIEIGAREQAQREVKRFQNELLDRDGRVKELAWQVEALQGELQSVAGQREQALRKLRSREERVVKLESTLKELRTPTRSREAASAAQGATGTAPEAALVEPETAATESGDKPRAIESPQPVTSASGFLLFVPREGQGYVLVETEGEPPAVGSEIELEGRTFGITRCGRSPLPFDRRVCVYLSYPNRL